MSWRGTEGGILVSSRGYRVIMSPKPKVVIGITAIPRILKILGTLEASSICDAIQEISIDKAVLMMVKATSGLS